MREFIRLHKNELPYYHPEIPGMLSRLMKTTPLNRFSDGESPELVGKIAELHQLSPENIVLTPGGSEGIRATLLALLKPESRIVFRTPTYGQILSIITELHMSPIPTHPDPFYAADILDFLDTLSLSDAHAIYIQNPHNPTGDFLPPEAIEDLLLTIPEDIPVIVDETYIPFADPWFEGVIHLIGHHPNLIVIRTFSQTFGLASLRIGYIAAPPQIACKIRARVRSIDLTPISQAAALVALSHIDEYQNIWRQIANLRGEARQKLLDRNIVVYPSKGNFLLMRVEDGPAVTTGLAERGILVRAFEVPSWMKGHIRVTITTEEEINAFFTALDSLPGEILHS